MVMPDLSSSFQEDNLKKQEFYSASAIDRFFSFVIDYLIFSPVVCFFLIALMKDSVQIFRTEPLGEEAAIITFILVFSYVFLFSALQSLFIIYWKGTPGQVFLKLQVHFENDRHFILLRAFERQVGFWFTFLFLGLPWVKVILHKRHQTFYDRIADVSIVTTKTGGNRLLKFENEINYWRSLYATVVIFVVGLSIGFIWNQNKKIVSGYYAFKHLEKKNYVCSDLQSVKYAERLPTAIALNLVNKLSDQCLDLEADFILWHGFNAGTYSSNGLNLMDMAYLAKSLTANDKSTETEYLKLACDHSEKDMACQISLAFRDANFEKLLTYLQKEDGFLATVLKYELAPQDSLSRAELLNELTDFSRNHQVKKYILSERLNLLEHGSMSRSPAAMNDEKENQLLKKLNQTEIDKLIEDL